MNRRFACMLLFLLFWISPGLSSEKQAISSIRSLDDLIELLNKHPASRLMFHQINQSQVTGQRIEAHGHIIIQKPDRFDWIYSTSPKNRIVCDGHHVMVITPDTQQVMMEKSVNQSVIWSPISILNHNSLENLFKLELLNQSNEVTRYRLIPLQPDQPYEYLEIAVFSPSSDVLFSITIFDLAGNVNALEFSSLGSIPEMGPITLPPIPEDYDVTDFMGHPQDFRFF